MTTASFEPNLTPEHHQFWLDNGYLVLPDFIYENASAALRNRATGSLNLEAAVQGHHG